MASRTSLTRKALLVGAAVAGRLAAAGETYEPTSLTFAPSTVSYAPTTDSYAPTFGGEPGEADPPAPVVETSTTTAAPVAPETSTTTTLIVSVTGAPTPEGTLGGEDAPSAAPTGPRPTPLVTVPSTSRAAPNPLPTPIADDDDDWTTTTRFPGDGQFPCFEWHIIGRCFGDPTPSPTGNRLLGPALVPTALPAPKPPPKGDD
mmetsp:Transcript_19628/g.58370  ORF Transcript_19628/g.58370 Transcript_19628/m.58370 type:complete len:203 (+) Transcript_19628:317-925(+)